MLKRVSAVAWSVVLVALFVEVGLGLRTTYVVIRFRPRNCNPHAAHAHALDTSTATPRGWTIYTSPSLGLSLFYPAIGNPRRKTPWNSPAWW